MSLSKDFEEYCKSIAFEMSDDLSTTIQNIAKKLNSEYYDLSDEKQEHMYIVGSTGRKTAVKSCSDIDLIFDLPKEVYDRFNAYESNGQSSLLQEVKEKLKERYPRTDISGDGQVVVIELSYQTIELVPGFKQSDDKFKYPDTHDGGSWKITDPLSEQKECQISDIKTAGTYLDLCRLIREWKNHIGFSFSGLLIDTFVYNKFDKDSYSGDYTYFNYIDLLKDMFEYISAQNEDGSYWFALGSNQKIYNKHNGKFATEAQKALDKIESAEENNEDLNQILRELLGTKFPKSTEALTQDMVDVWSGSNSSKSTEQFIEDLFSVDIKYTLNIDCQFSQNGFRTFGLRELLSRDKTKRFIGIKKKLEFEIQDTNCPKPYTIYWKIRNVGEEAKRRNCIRGQILKGESKKVEHSDFNGPHFVECYLVKNNVCVARDKIDVPIRIV